MEKDKLIKVLLNPCAGSKKNSSNHIYIIDEIYDSGLHLGHQDYLTIEEAKEKYESLGANVTLTRTHDHCLECIMEMDNLTKEEAINYLEEAYSKDKYQHYRRPESL
jgi:hypothetical protein